MSVGLFAKLAKEAAPILENPSALKAAGKIASLLTGNMALKSMRQQPAYAMPQQGYYPQIQQQPYYPAVQENPQQQEDNNPVYRSRHL